MAELTQEEIDAATAKALEEKQAAEEEGKDNPEALTEEEKAAAAKAEEEGEDAGTGGENEGETEEEKAEREAAEAAAAKKASELTPEEKLRIELAEVKERNTNLDQTLRNMEAKFAGYDKILREANMLDEVDEEQQKAAELAAQGRRVFLNQMWETMLMSPKYEDIEQVVTAHNKQLVISAYAEQLVEEDPTLDQATAEIAVKQAIDERTNPHKFFYDQIKIIEKGATEGETEEEKKKREEAEKITKKKPELKDTPGSVNNMGGASKGGAGWTMKKLDDMDEEDMAKADIPEDILEQWKAGTLPK